MFSQTWKKYLPVIAILIKRSSQGDQTLNLNLTDFERAAGGRKMKFSFNNLVLKNSKLNFNPKQTAVAKELATILQEDESTKTIIQDMHLEFSLSNDFLLTIRNIAPADAEVEESVSDSNSED